MKSLNIKSFTLSALFLGLAQTSAMGFSLDAFSSFEGGKIFQSVQIPQFAGNGTQVSDTQSSLNSTVFGGSRTLQLTKLDNVLTPSQASLSAFDGSAELSSPSYQSRAEIIWDGLDDSGTSQNIELDSNGEIQRSFQINVESLNLGIGNGDLSLNFEIRDTSNNSATITRTITSNIDNPQSLFFRYQNRVGTANLGQIDYIRFYTSDENVGDDFVFNFIQSSEEVPFEFSPSLGLILGGSLFGFLNLQKKLKKRQSKTL